MQAVDTMHFNLLQNQTQQKQRSPAQMANWIVAMLRSFKENGNARLSSSALVTAMENQGYCCTLRSAQRNLNLFAEIGLIYGDKSIPRGWRLTDEGRYLLGVADDGRMPS